MERITRVNGTLLLCAAGVVATIWILPNATLPLAIMWAAAALGSDIGSAIVVSADVFVRDRSAEEETRSSQRSTS